LPDRARLSWSCTTLQSSCPKSLAALWVNRSPHVLGACALDYRVLTTPDAANAREIVDDSLSWACALLQSAPSSKPPLAITRSRVLVRVAPSMRFAPLQRFPAQGSGNMVRLASPHHLRPQVFSTSRRFDPPRACRPCFMPNPLMGLHPSELFSSRAAVRRLRRLGPPVVGTSSGVASSGLSPPEGGLLPETQMRQIRDAPKRNP
jgi:hypothetical protein